MGAHRVDMSRVVAEAPFYLAELRKQAKASGGEGPSIDALEKIAKAVAGQQRAEEKLAEAVDAARSAGWSWGQIAPLVGFTTPQGAGARYRR